MNEKQIEVVTEYLKMFKVAEGIALSLAKEISEEIDKHQDFGKIPSWAKYRAMNSDGSYRYFESRPTRYGTIEKGFWMADGNSGWAAFFKGWENSDEEIK
jgi:hypothetical protein